MAVQGDVAVESDVVGLFDTVRREMGNPIGLVNNAGIVALQSRLEDMTAERLQRVFAVNIVGTFICSRETA